jgi:beta-barrel assembly-enhancing protease
MKCKFLIVIVFLLLFLPFKIYGLSLEEEKKYGKEIYLEIAKSAALNNDPYIALYLRTMKERLEGVASLPFPIVLTIIESQAVDAFATIGGYVYITTGLIGLCDKEQELAGVLAHEFAHIGRRHVAKRLEKQKYINVGMLAATLLSILIGDPKALAAGAASAQAMSLKYSRDDEEEADRVGSTTADRAGYGGLGVAEFLKKVRATATDKVLPQYLLTHPYHEERIIKIESMWGESKVTVNTALFPYLLVREKILHKPPGGGMEDIWINKYLKDKNDPINAYAASLIYSLKGNMDESINVAKKINSPYKNLLLGELLLNAQRFKDAIDTLKDEPDPVPRYFLARAYEGYGERVMATNVLKELLQYGNAYPEIFYRLGMMLGRMGQEAEGYEYLGRYYLEIGKYDIAKTHLEKAVTKYGINSREAKEILKILDELKKTNW